MNSRPARRLAAGVLVLFTVVAFAGWVRRVSFFEFNGCSDVGVIRPDGSTGPLPECESPWSDHRAAVWLAVFLLGALSLAVAHAGRRVRSLSART